MAQKQENVDGWLTRETEHVRQALENASRYFARTDLLTVNTLEAIYGEESSFGLRRGKRGIDDPAGDFQILKGTAQRYHLIVNKQNDQRFDIDYASIAAARYLKDLNGFFGKPTILAQDLITIPVVDLSERMKFVLAAYNMGEGSIARAQELAQEVGKDPRNWDDVKGFLEEAGVKSSLAEQGRKYVDDVIQNEKVFAKKSSADKKVKNKRPGASKGACSKGHWITKDHHHIFICE